MENTKSCVMLFCNEMNSQHQFLLIQRDEQQEQGGEEAQRMPLREPREAESSEAEDNTQGSLQFIGSC